MGTELEDLSEEIYGINSGMKKIGLIINPIAGMGGSVGLKGTDHVVEEAIRRGAVPMAEKRAEIALLELLPLRSQFTFYSCPGGMGGELAERMGFSVVLLDKPGEKETEGGAETGTGERENCAGNGRSGEGGGAKGGDSAESGDRVESGGGTDAFDTIKLAKRCLEEQVDLILFAGGDGTARNIYEAVGLDAPCVGVPAGVKIHSPVYARNPKAAGQLTALWLQGKVSRTSEKEVLDIDEDEYREERINTRLYGYLTIPEERNLIQNRKAPTPLSDTAAIESIAYEVVDHMERDTFYLVGAGTTTRGIMHFLGLKNTLIGVDLIYNKKLVANDVYGDAILSFIKGRKTKLIVTITGGQGFLFGRGNQQLTPAVIREIGKENILILATKAKLAALGGSPLLVDTIDTELNHELCGFYRTITGFGEFTMCRVSDV